MAQLLDGADLNGQKASNAATPTASADLTTKSYVDTASVSRVVTLTGAGAATAGAVHIITMAASLGAQAITLPAAPPQGTKCTFLRSDNTGFTSFAQISAAAGDTMKEASPYIVGGANMGVTFVYIGTSWYTASISLVGMSGLNWSSTSNSLGPSVMVRNSSGRSAISDPVNPTDITNKQYVDAFKYVRTTATATTSSLASGATDSTTKLTMAVGYRLYSISCSRPARVRLYATDAQKTADLSRAIGTTPAAGAGVVLDYVAAAAATVYPLSPLVDGVNLETTPVTTIPMAVTNNDSSTGTVVVTVVWIRTE